MQYIRMPSDDEIPSEAREFIEAESRRRGGAPVSAAIRTLAWRPEIMKAVATLQRVVVTGGTVDVELKALVAQAVSQAAGCSHCQAHAAFMASRVGGHSDRVKALWEFETSDLFSAGDRAALRLAVAAGGVPNTASEENFAELRKYFDEGQIVEIVATMALFGWNNRWNETVATETEEVVALFALDALGGQGFELSRHGHDFSPR